MDIHERNNHLECNMNNEGTRSHYNCPTYPLCSPSNTNRPLSCCPNPLLRAGLPLPVCPLPEEMKLQFPSSRLLGSEGARQGLLQTWGPTGPILKLRLSAVKLEKKNK